MIRVLLLLLFVSPLYAAPPTLGIPDEIKPSQGYATFEPGADCTAKAITYISRSSAFPFPARMLKDGRMFVLPTTGLANGRYQFTAVGSLNDEHAVKDFAVVVGNAPGPNPGPNPPNPPNPDQVAPIPVDGFRVMVVYEKSDLTKLTPQQHSILYGTEVRDYLARKCAVGPDGRTSESRFYDQNTVMTNESQLWQDAMKRPRTSLPWLVVSNGKSGWEGPLPANIEATMSILKTYGGE